MAGLRFADIQNKVNEILDLTSVTLKEFQVLVLIFKEKYQAHMSQWYLDGREPIARRYTTYANCPLPTPEDRLLFILIFVKNNPLQTLHGRLFAMVQCKANQWIHLLLPVLLEALKQMGDTPSRSIADLAMRLGICQPEVAAILCSSSVGLAGVSELEVSQPQSAEVLTPLTPTTVNQRPANAAQAAPLFVMMQRSDPLDDPQIRLNKKAIIAARRSTTRQGCFIFTDETLNRDNKV
jgi:hypothetical protein